MLRLILLCIDARTQPYRPTSNQHHRQILRLLVGKLAKRIPRRKIARRENIRHQHQRILLNLRRRLHHRRIRQRHPHILRLLAIQRGGAKQLPLLAPRAEPVPAVEASAARRGEGRDDAVARRDALHRRPNLRDGSRELVAHDEARG